jgi:hypothetical protein
MSQGQEVHKALKDITEPNKPKKQPVLKAGG